MLNFLVINLGLVLRVDDNKTEVFKYLAEQTVSEESTGEQVLSTSVNFVSPCTHKEAVTRLLLHALDAGEEGFKRVIM